MTNHNVLASRTQIQSKSPTPEEKTSYKAILFDIDGTLANSWKLGYDATAAILQKNNIAPITEEIYHECTRYCTPHRLALHAGLNPTEETFQEVGNALAKEFDEMYVDLVSTQTAGFYPGMHDLLNDISPRVKIGALTNACLAYADAVLKVNSIHDRFISVHGADSVPKVNDILKSGLFSFVVSSLNQIQMGYCTYAWKSM